MHSSSQNVTTNKPTPIFYRPDALPGAQQKIDRVHKVWDHLRHETLQLNSCIVNKVIRISLFE